MSLGKRKRDTRQHQQRTRRESNSKPSLLSSRIRQIGTLQIHLQSTVGNHCHVGAGAVLAGVIEPASATPVIVEDDVLIGANAVVIEGCRIGKGAVVAAGAVVVSDVPAGTVVAGCPARGIKTKDEKTASKTALEEALREL